MEPPNWWVGMEESSVEVMVYSRSGISDLKPSIQSASAAVTIAEVGVVSNPNYLFITLDLSKVLVGDTAVLLLTADDGTERHKLSFPILARDKRQQRSISASDVVYLLTPDRFANGDTNNDIVSSMQERAVDRNEPYGRHGGDLQGMIDHLPYMADMGYTCIWPNPLLENDMPSSSYHGYATTDYYEIDPRYGDNDLYRDFCTKANEAGLTVIMDQIANHCGAQHWWMADLPHDEWVHDRDSIQICNHSKTTAVDPYASDYDRSLMEDGWFVSAMPDLNQTDPHLSRYLIQNSIWWIEYAGLAGIRQDTYSYPDKDFLTRWTCAIMQQYPDFYIVGEEWTDNPVLTSYWQAGSVNIDGYESCLPAVMDFPMNAALTKALTEDAGWSTGMRRLYQVLSYDVLYPDPSQLMIFADNHDMSRIYTQVDEQIGLWKIAMAYVATMRGIPQIYYGTEILMSNKGTDSHGVIRSDFPGGWSGDMVDAFTGVGLSDQASAAQQWLRRLLRWRKDKTVLHTGMLLHYEPVDEVYVYARYNESDKVVVLLNKSEQRVELDLARYHQILHDMPRGIDVLTGDTIELETILSVPAQSVFILE